MPDDNLKKIVEDQSIIIAEQGRAIEALAKKFSETFGIRGFTPGGIDWSHNSPTSIDPGHKHTNASLNFEYGEIYVLGNSTETTIAGAGTFAQFVGFAVNGQSSGAVPDHTNDHITIGSSGKYLIVCSFHAESVAAGGADTLSIEIRKNNGVTSFSNLHAHRKLAGGGGDVASVSISGLADLTAGDTIEVWLTNDDSADDILIADANVSLLRIS